VPYGWGLAYGDGILGLPVAGRGVGGADRPRRTPMPPPASRSHPTS
jgi:hypothetical protein